MALEFDLKKELKTIFGFSSFKGEQEEIINSVLKKKSINFFWPVWRDTGLGECVETPGGGVTVLFCEFHTIKVFYYSQTWHQNNFQNIKNLHLPIDSTLIENY